MHPKLPSSIQRQLESYRTNQSNPREVVATALSRANSNAGRNVYLALDEMWSFREAEKQAEMQRVTLQRQPLWGIPVSLKDCFDLEGFITTCGSKVLGEDRHPAEADSAVASRLRRRGAVIIGKTHLHQLAYGITGENHDFGDCLQPDDPGLLTGGSTSGGAASVQEGSAMAAIGTDTGGSIRVPAALCGLAGYRASITLANAEGIDLWQGGEHLAPSFDTIGWIYRDLADGPLLGSALFDLPKIDPPSFQGLRIGMADAAFLYDCDKEVLSTLDEWARTLKGYGAQIEFFDATIWSDSINIFSPLQASEAAALHPEPRDVFEPDIAHRLRWGSTLASEELTTLRDRLAIFRQETERHLRAFDLLLLPTCPRAELRAGVDHSKTRMEILRYTTPVSLLGWPAITLPGRRGAPQLVGRLGADAELLALSSTFDLEAYK